MPLALTATPDPANAGVRLHVTGAAAGPVSIVRSDRNGLAEVRQHEGSLPVAGDLVVDDWEAALDGPVTWTVTDAAGAASTADLPAGLGVDTPWISHPGRPSLNRPVTVRSDDEPEWAGRATRHDVIGRAVPVYVTQPLGGRSGVLELLAASWDEARAIRDVYTDGVPVLLRQPCLTGADYYHVPDSVRLAPATARRWRDRWVVTVRYAQVDYPYGAPVGTRGWTYQQTTAASDNYTQSATLFPVYADRTAGLAS